MKNISKAYSELCKSMKNFTDEKSHAEIIESIKRLIDEVENAKLKLVVTSDGEGEPTAIDEIIRGALEKSPIFRPSIDDIMNEAYSLSVTLANHPSKDFNTSRVTQNDVYKMILSYFPNNPKLMDYVSDVVINGVINDYEYHTSHWYYTYTRMIHHDIDFDTRLKLIDYITESGDIEINGYRLAKSFVSPNAIERMVEIMNKIHEEEIKNEESK